MASLYIVFIFTVNKCSAAYSMFVLNSVFFFNCVFCYDNNMMSSLQLDN